MRLRFFYNQTAEDYNIKNFIEDFYQCKKNRVNCELASLGHRLGFKNNCYVLYPVGIVIDFL